MSARNRFLRAMMQQILCYKYRTDMKYFALPSMDVINKTVDYLGPAKPFFALFGACTATYAILKASWSIIRGTTFYFLADPLHLGVNFRKFAANDGWAVVTGATDGLGLAFAKELAKRGVNVLLVGRNSEKLDMVAREIESKYRVKADILVVDFRHATLDEYSRIKSRLKKVRIDVLVNNVGMAAGAGNFGTHPNTDQLCFDLLHVNVLSMLMFTNCVLPGMKERKKGIIINLSSVAAVYPLPSYGLYGSTKSMIDFFSKALDLECRPYGIFVMSVLPGPVLTNMTRNFGKSVFLVQAGPFARDTLSQVGLWHKTYGHWIHALMVTLATPIPLWIALKLLRPRSHLRAD